jgi:hypothetical protein
MLFSIVWQLQKRYNDIPKENKLLSLVKKNILQADWNKFSIPSNFQF